jgi:hypothetical protein
MARKQTVQKLVGILIDEIGLCKAFHLIQRIQLEVRGNKSFEDTIRAVRGAVEKHCR